MQECDGHVSVNVHLFSSPMLYRWAERCVWCGRGRIHVEWIHRHSRCVTDHTALSKAPAHISSRPSYSISAGQRGKPPAKGDISPYFPYLIPNQTTRILNKFLRQSLLPNQKPPPTSLARGLDSLHPPGPSPSYFPSAAHLWP